MCCLVILIALFIFPLVNTWWGNLSLAKTFEINLVLIMNDYLMCAKNNGSIKK